VMVGIATANKRRQTYRVAVQVENRGDRGISGGWGGGPYTLQPDATWRAQSTGRCLSGQDQMVEFLLLMDDSPKPYRSLRLWLDVKRSTTTPFFQVSVRARLIGCA